MLQVLALVAGIAIIIVGAELLVDGAIKVARSREVSEAIIGLTVVAIGTTAFELVTTLVSTVRGGRDIAIAAPPALQDRHPSPSTIPRVRGSRVRYTEAGIARAMFQVAVSGRREQGCRSSPSCGAARPSSAVAVEGSR